MFPSLTAPSHVSFLDAVYLGGLFFLFAATGRFHSLGLHIHTCLPARGRDSGRDCLHADLHLVCGWQLTFLLRVCRLAQFSAFSGSLLCVTFTGRMLAARAGPLSVKTLIHQLYNLYQCMNSNSGVSHLRHIQILCFWTGFITGFVSRFVDSGTHTPTYFSFFQIRILRRSYLYLYFDTHICSIFFLYSQQPPSSARVPAIHRGRVLHFITSSAC
jgi:hypothetical protein